MGLKGTTTVPKLTLKGARELEAAFTGRITTAHEARAEFRGEPTVLVPESVDDVERALRLTRAANRRVFVRSGRGVSTADVTRAAGAARAAAAASEPAAVLSLEAFRGVEVGDGRVTVGASATTGDVARQLAGRDLFLPLDDNRTRSMASAVLGLDASPFLRSGTGTGPLRDAVVEAEAVPTEGVGAGRATTLRDGALRRVLTGERAAVLTKLVFDADAAKRDDAARWVEVWTAAYERRTFAALCTALFGARARRFPARADLSLRVTSAAYAMKLVIVRASGLGDAAAVEAFVQAAFAKARLDVLETKQSVGPGASVAAWVAAGPGEAARGETILRFGSNLAPRPFAALRRPFLSAVELTLGVDPRTGRERAPRVRGWAELQLAANGDVLARAEISAAAAHPSVAKRVRDRVAAAIPPDATRAKATVARAALVRRAPAADALRGAPVLEGLAPTSGFAFTASNRAGASIIPGFQGDVFDRASGQSYLGAIQQYAVSSYDAAVVAARMTPRYVAVPLDAADVALAVAFAAAQSLKVVARSGGHQYCGLSSGGADTLLVDLRRFTQVVFSAVSAATGAPTRVTLGPGVALEDASKALRDHGVVFPHGECPLVNLGGHVQTGGIGHQLRSLGAALDAVRSFKMVARDPQSVADAYVERTYQRPMAGGGAGAPTDDDVFAAVLGGGPSSWGVVTEITFDLVADREHPRSAGYSYPYPYLLGAAKEGFRAAMECFRQWADRQSRGALPPGVDLFLTVVSGDFPRPPALFVETMCMDAAGLAEIKAVVDAVDAAVPTVVRWAAHAASQVNGPAGLSVIADEGVRKIGVTGLPRSGREFDLPYKKSLHVTTRPFTAAFRDAFVDLVDAAYRAPGLKVVFQGVIGGGAFLANGQQGVTHMQRRDGLVQLVFDVFYEPGYEAAAAAMQRAMKALLGSYSGGVDARMLWGSFEDEGTGGAQLDMGQAATQALYYDSPAEYARLQAIKRYADPRDLFHTSFTVQP